MLECHGDRTTTLPVVGKVGPMTMALQLRRAERAGGGRSSSMVLQHVEEDETNDAARSFALHI